MDFSFEIEDAVLTGNIQPEVLSSLGDMTGMFLGGMVMIWLSLYIAIIIFMVISRWKVFKKAGFPGRGILIPIYNLVLMFKLGGMSGRWTASIIVPPVFVVAMIVNYFKIAEKFGKHRTFGIGLLLLKIVFIPIIAFDNSKRGKQTNKIPTPTTQTPIAKKPIAKKPIAKKLIAKKPVAKKPVAKKLIAKKPVAKKPVAKK